MSGEVAKSPEARDIQGMRLSRRTPVTALLLTTPLLSLASLAWMGCSKTGERVDDTPTPSASATTTAAAPATAEPTQTAAATPPRTPTGAPVPGTKADGGAPTDAGAGKPDAAATTDAGSTGSAKFKACFDKCQGVLATCLTSGLSKDGGAPQPPNPVACQTAFSTCQAACAP